MINEKKLNLACGDSRMEGFKGVDILKSEFADYNIDLEQFPWYIESDSVEEVFCSHYVEHTPDLVKFMNELHRIMKVGGKATIIAPYYACMRAWQDPTHKRAICENTFFYFNKGWRVANKIHHIGIDENVDFDFTYGYTFSPEWAMRSEEAKAFAVKNYINVVWDIQVVLTKRPLS